MVMESPVRGLVSSVAAMLLVIFMVSFLARCYMVMPICNAHGHALRKLRTAMQSCYAVSGPTFLLGLEAQSGPELQPGVVQSTPACARSNSQKLRNFFVPVALQIMQQQHTPAMRWKT